MGGGASSKLKIAGRNFFLQTCGSFCEAQQSSVLDNSSATPVCNDDSAKYSSLSGIAGQCSRPCCSNSKKLCTICLGPLNYNSGLNSGQAIFTAQCSHSFHLGCISSNVRHGSVTCPICRSHWTQLPLDPTAAAAAATFRFEPDPTASNGGPSLGLSLTYPTPPNFFIQASTSHSTEQARLRVRLTHAPAIDLVLVASSNGPHLRLVKQAMAIVVFSLNPIDRLAIVTYSSTTAVRVSPLRPMTSTGKRTALQVIDRVFYMGKADPIQGLVSGVKILEERAHTNPRRSSILHLTDAPSRSHRWFDSVAPVTIQRFHLGLGFTAHEFEEFLLTALCGSRVEDRKGQLNVEFD